MCCRSRQHPACSCQLPPTACIAVFLHRRILLYLMGLSRALPVYYGYGTDRRTTNTLPHFPPKFIDAPAISANATSSSPLSGKNMGWGPVSGCTVPSTHIGLSTRTYLYLLSRMPYLPWTTCKNQHIVAVVAGKCTQ